ncbi:heme exporter protein CcmD [Sansalvadorimonas verongulae]|uniref:heme exporter protein CcmD n=1 Tax=Sansalvadorimonas verongulae TaxID=2172824 RepID=UPI0012BD2155|nr:heme exporter protein CcmD [Sansalvadorimonas verongulae]MTI13789.1 heme exporter protein CcmD [Sansalvadorimonas verongulae]
MYFESLSDLFTMGGHGPYVWAAYGIGLSVLVWNLLSPVLQGRRLASTIRRNALRDTVRKEHIGNEQLKSEGCR